MADAYPPICMTTTATPGTSAYVLNTANRTDHRHTPKQMVSIGLLSDGDEVLYFTIDSSASAGGDFELGSGTYNDTANTISRSSANVESSSNGVGVLVSWPATGQRDIMLLGVLASKTPRLDRNNAFEQNISVAGTLAVGLASPSTNLHIQESNTDTIPALEIEQLSTGDAALQVSNPSAAFALGIDTTVNSFILSYASSPGTAVLGTNNILTATTSGILGVQATMLINRASTMNSDGGAYDTRIKGQTDDNLFFADGSADAIGIGTPTPGTKFHVQESNTSTTPAVEIEQLSTGDAGMMFSIVGDCYAVGIDNSDSDKFKISYAASAGNAVLGTSDRLILDSSGNFGFGGDPSTNIHIQESNTDTIPALEVEQLSTGDAAIQVSIVGASYAVGIDNSDSDKFKISYAATAGTAVLGTNDRLVMDSSGSIGIGTATPDGFFHIHSGSAGAIAADADADELTVEGSGSSVGISILSPDTSSCAIYFGEASNAQRGKMVYDHPNQRFTFTVENSVAALLSSSGLTVGNTTNAGILTIKTGTEVCAIVDAGSVAATEQDWIEVKVGGVTGYIRVFASK